MSDPYNDPGRRAADTTPPASVGDPETDLGAFEPAPDALDADEPAPDLAARPARSAEEALRRFALGYSNWQFDSLARARERLAGLAAGELRAQLMREARDAADEASQRASTQSNRGRVIGVLAKPGEPAYVITHETAAFGDNAVQGGWFIYRARAVEEPDGWRVAEWTLLN